MLDLLQSPQDTPCRIRYPAQRRKAPPELFLSKWREEAYLSLKTADRYERTRDIRRQGNTLQVTTNKRAHLIHRLNDEHIEYDILINEAPKGGEITLPLQFPQGLAFYKQGQAMAKVRPEVAGSLAVYWKNRNNQYKTGKLCHIYRPRLFDAKGRFAWGEIDHDGKNLILTLPEAFLKTAAYPVTVDPVIGTSSVGASYQIWDGEWMDFGFEMIMPANRYIVQEALSGNCTASFYSYKTDGDARGYPCLYSDSSGTPASRLSSNEAYADLRNPNASGEWIDAAFTVPATIPAGTAVWFAFMTHYFFFPHWDDGGTTGEMNVESYSSVPATFTPVSYTPESRLISMYFTYISSQNYTRSLANPAGNGDALSRYHQALRVPALLTMATQDALSRSKGMSRGEGDEMAPAAETARSTGMDRRAEETASPADGHIPRINRLRQALSSIGIATTMGGLLTKTRTIPALLSPGETLSRTQELLRQPRENSPTRDKLTRTQEVERAASSEVNPTAHPIRRAMIFLKHLEFTEIWDYLTRRKAKSKEEVLILSPIAEEVEIDSPI